MQRRALVVGAGVGGLCAGIGLGRSGWQVTVVERWPAVTGIGAGIGVWPDAQAALDRLGLTDDFLARAVDFGAGSIFTASGRRLCAVPSARVERRGGRPIRILSRAALIDLLASATREHAEISTAIDPQETARLAGDADLVVGADGLRSQVRAAGSSFLGTRPVPTGYVAWRGQVEVELDAAAYGETWGDGMLCGITRMARGCSNVYVAAPAELTSFDDVRERFADWRDPIPPMLERIGSGRVLRHSIDELRPHLSTYVTANTALVGDAAHAMTPSLGRGACEAILDAAVLVDEVASGEMTDGLRRYDARRRRATQRTVDRSRRALSIATARRTGARDAMLRMASPLMR